jgi:hypothetical protein
MLIGTSDDLLTECDSLRRAAILRGSRHVTNLSEQHEVARLELENMLRRVDAVEGALADSDVPVVVE